MERKETKVKRNLLTGFTIITFNLWILHLFLNFYYFIYVPAVFSIINIIWIFASFIKNKQREELLNERIFSQEVLSLSKKFIKMNRRYILVSILGIVMATIIISQAFIISSTYEQQRFNDLFGSEYTSPALEFRWRGIQNLTEFEMQVEEMKPKIIQLFEENELVYKYQSQTNQMRFQVSIGKSSFWDQNSLGYMGMRSLEWDNATLEAISNIPSLKRSDIKINQSELTVFLNPNDIEIYPQIANHITSTKTMPIVVGEAWRVESNFTNINYFNVTVDNVIRLEEADIDWYFNQFDYQIIDDLFWGSLVTDAPTQIEFFTQFQASFDEYQVQPVPEIESFLQVFTELPEINQKELNNLLIQLSKLERDAYSIDISNFGNSFRVYSPLIWDIQNFQGEAVGARFVLLLLGLPMITLSIFLVYFSLIMVEQKKRRILSVMRVRGTSNLQMRAFLLSEVFSAGVIAFATGMVLSIPWTFYILKNSGLLNLGLGLTAVSIPPDWFWKMPIIGITLTLNLNITSILSLTKVKIDDAEQAIEQNKPLWQRLYLDLVLFGSSSIVWLIIIFVPFSNPQIRQIIVYGLGPLALFILLISSPLIIARYFGGFISWLSNYLWKVQGGMGALALRNLKKNKYTSSRLVALLMLGLMLSMVTLMFPVNIDNITYTNNRYYTAADIVVSNIDIDNSTLMNNFAIDEVQSYSEVVRVNALNPEAGDNFFFDDNTIREYNFLGVNPSTFANSVYWENSYSQYDIEDIVTSIEEDGTIGLQKDELTGLGLDIDNKLALVMGSDQSEEFLIKTSYKYFPGLVNSLPRPSWNNPDQLSFDSLSIFASIDTVQSLALKYNFESDNLVYVNVADGKNITLVKEKLEIAFSDTPEISIRSYVDSINEELEVETTELIFSMMSSLFIITIITSTIGILYFSFMTLSERMKEIGVFRSLGMVKLQIFRLLLIEALSILLAGLITGLFFGYFITINFFSLLFENDRYYAPPHNFIIPWGLVAQFVGIMSILALLAAAIPAWIISNKQTGSILRAE